MPDHTSLPDSPDKSPSPAQGGWFAAALREILGTFLPAIILALVLHVFLAQATIVYGESMEPNFYNDQRLIVEKVTYHLLHPPERGDVVVLLDPNDGPLPLIKRVIGLPGEQVTVADGQVMVDGMPLLEPYLDQLTMYPNQAWTVPPGHVFVMGDNRADSLDSRYFGPVPLESIIGRAVFRYWPLTDVGLAQ